MNQTATAQVKTKVLRPLAALLFVAFTTLFAFSQARPPKLVLQITVDQLRGDLPERYLDRMGEGGFRYLLEQGVVFKDAHHAHANTETIVGHATLSTGAHPAAHGMVANVWFDRETGRLVYNIEDADYPLLSADADVNKATEIDPTQKTAVTSGRSPVNIQVSTLSDELALQSAGRSKVFGVSIKDRGAVSMAGHSGKAFWFSKEAGEFVTSQFYYERYPAWVVEWNATRPTRKYSGQEWDLLHDRETYLFGKRDDQTWETDFPGYGRTFPHPFGDGDDKYFTTRLTLSPVGDLLTLDFARTLIKKESIGADEVTDYLSVSFSSTDYVGHLFGSSSLEMEDNLLRLDRTLAALLSYVDEQVGLEHTLIVLSADHGGPEVPDLLLQYKIPAGYVNPKRWETESGIARLKQRFGIGQEIIREFYPPYVYLDRDAVQKKGLDSEQLEAAIAEEIGKLRGVALAVPSGALLRGEVPDTALTRMVLNNHNVKRSGDIYVVFEPHWFINDFDGLTVASTHGSPWRYDTFVPVVFAGCGLRSRKVHRRVNTVDVAPTIAAWVGAKPPSGAAGQILVEVVDQRFQ